MIAKQLDQAVLAVSSTSACHPSLETFRMVTFQLFLSEYSRVGSMIMQKR